MVQLTHRRHPGLCRGGVERGRPSTVRLRRTVPLPERARGGLCGDEGVDRRVLLRGEIPNLLGNLHRAEFWAAHRAEVRGLGALGG